LFLSCGVGQARRCATTPRDRSSPSCSPTGCTPTRPATWTLSTPCGKTSTTLCLLSCRSSKVRAPNATRMQRSGVVILPRAPLFPPLTPKQRGTSPCPCLERAWPCVCVAEWLCLPCQPPCGVIPRWQALRRAAARRRGQDPCWKLAEVSRWRLVWPRVRTPHDRYVGSRTRTTCIPPDRMCACWCRRQCVPAAVLTKGTCWSWVLWRGGCHRGTPPSLCTCTARKRRSMPPPHAPARARAHPPPLPRMLHACCVCLRPCGARRCLRVTRVPAPASARANRAPCECLPAPHADRNRWDRPV
jgi:hypothetical protein